jgi:hypothetical protein
MAASKYVGKAKSLAWVQVGTVGGSAGTSPCSKLQKGTVSQSAELSEFTNGDSDVKTRFPNSKDASISVEIADMSVASLFAAGQSFTAVVLTFYPANTAAATAETGRKFTLSHAMCTEVGDVEASNDSAAPATRTVTFTLDDQLTGTATGAWADAS